MPFRAPANEGMRMRIMRVGIVSLLLFGPLMLYLSLRTSGTNYYELPVYFQSPPADSSSTGTSEKGITCLSYTYPYTVFSHPGGSNYAVPGKQVYLMHAIEPSSTFQFIEAFHHKMLEHGQAVSYGFHIPGVELAGYDVAEQKDWQLHAHSPDGLSYLRDCVLRAPELFGGTEAIPSNWSILLDSTGAIRGHFDMSDQEEFRDGLAQALILIGIN